MEAFTPRGAFAARVFLITSKIETRHGDYIVSVVHNRMITANECTVKRSIANRRNHNAPATRKRTVSDSAPRR